MTRTLVFFVMLALAACGGAQTGADEARADPLESIDAEELYRRGMLLARGGDYARAEQYLAASMDRGVEAERVVPALLAVCVEASRLAAALDYAEPYLEANPEQWSLRMLVASIRMGLGHHQQAREELERVLEDAPDEPQAYYSSASCTGTPSTTRTPRASTSAATSRSPPKAATAPRRAPP